MAKVVHSTNIDEYVESLMMKEISDTSVISKAEEQALFKQYEVADYETKQDIKVKLLNSNMRFVLKVALYYKNRMPVDLNELVSEGKIGLLMAIDLFDWRTDNKFISFAVWHIKCKISKYLECRDLIHLPAHQKVKLNRAKREMDVASLDDDLQYLYNITQTPISFDSPLGDTEFTIQDTIFDSSIELMDTKYSKAVLSSHLEDLIKTILNRHEYEVIVNLYGLCGKEAVTLRETKDIIGKSHERVRQLRNSALRKLYKNKDIKKFASMFADNESE